jgi:hypothetical protein
MARSQLLHLHCGMRRRHCGAARRISFSMRIRIVWLRHAANDLLLLDLTSPQ